MKYTSRFSTLICCIAFLTICNSNPVAGSQAGKPDPDFYLFLLAGQSNMAGRGIPDSLSRVIDPRIMMLNKNNEWVPAADPVHFDKPEAGVGPGISFAQNMLKQLGNKKIKIGLIPAAVGGTSIDKWVPGAFDSITHSHPYDDALLRAKAALQKGVLKGILWHQGSSDSSPEKRKNYMDKLVAVISRFRNDLDMPALPFIAGELGHYNQNKQAFNIMLQSLPARAIHTSVVKADGLTPNADSIHFNTNSARLLGSRYAAAMKELSQVTHRDILAGIQPEQLKQFLLSKEAWKPFPATSAGWQQYLSDSTIKKIIHDAEAVMAEPYASISATVTLDYVRDGNRDTYQQLSFTKRRKLFNLALAESMENRGRFADAIADGVWNICEETYWGVPAHLFVQKAGSGLPDVSDPTVDLFAAETAAVLALTDYLAGPALDKVSPLLRKRIYTEVDRRILLPLETSANRYRHLGARGKDTAVNNWNPWIISNWMTTLLLLEKDPERRFNEFHHSLVLLDLYINGLGADGAADEGPEYWFAAGAALFDALTVFQDATAGKINILANPFFQRIGSYIYKTHIKDASFISVADAHQHINIDAVLLYRFGKAVSDTMLQQFGSWAIHHSNDSATGPKRFYRTRTLYNLLSLQECIKAPAAEPLLEKVWLETIELMASRTANGLYIASHGGHNGESHNHNDVGDFIIYAGNKPVIIDAGSGTYTSATFSSARYSLWYNSSPYHNLPTINNIQQVAGAGFKATDTRYKEGTNTDRFALDIAKAYPPDAGIDSWIRNITVQKKKSKIEIKDHYKFSLPNTALTQTFMTVCNTDISKPGNILFNAGARTVTLHYDAADWIVFREPITLNKPDEKDLITSWGATTIWRLLLKNSSHKQKGVFTYSIQ